MMLNTSINPNSGPAKLRKQTTGNRRRLFKFSLLLAIVIETYLLTHGLKSERYTEQQPPIAELIQKQNTVKTQGYNQLYWEDSIDQQPLFRNQLLLTADKSRAEIAFLDGTGLVLGENSLIEIEQNKASSGFFSTESDEIVVKLLRGSLHKARQSPKKGIRKQSFKLKLDHTLVHFDPHSEFKVEQNNNPLSGAQEYKIFVAADSGAVTTSHDSEPSALVKLEYPKVTLLSPHPGDIIEGDPIAKILFRTRSNFPSTQTPTSIEISPDPSFKKDVRHFSSVSGDSLVQLPISENPRQWYWRATKGEHQSFWLQKPTLPVLQYPPSGAHFLDRQSIEFIWDQISTSESYDVEIKTSDGSVKTHRAPQNSYQILSSSSQDALPLGTNQWRVRANLSNQHKSSWSLWRIIQIDPTILPPPALIFDPEVEPIPRKKNRSD